MTTLFLIGIGCGLLVYAVLTIVNVVRDKKSKSIKKEDVQKNK